MDGALRAMRCAPRRNRRFDRTALDESPNGAMNPLVDSTTEFARLSRVSIAVARPFPMLSSTLGLRWTQRPAPMRSVHRPVRSC